MRKKNNIDFVIYDNKYESLIFRFLPNSSSCHSFGDEPPKTWKEVYKVYYEYKIIHKCKSTKRITEIFNSGCDECSIIDEVSTVIKYIVEGKERITVNLDDEERVIELFDREMLPCGDGVSWIINKTYDGYRLTLWKWDATGYRFNISKEKLKKFGEYLSECCEYMLAHGVPC